MPTPSDEYRILITGSREWKDYDAVVTFIADAVLAEADRRGAVGPTTWVTIVHGDCPTGADYLANLFSDGICAWKTEKYPADWKTYGKGAGPVRNQQMVDLGADVCLAFPLPGGKGTQDCMKKARKAGIPVLLAPGAEE